MAVEGRNNTGVHVLYNSLEVPLYSNNFRTLGESGSLRLFLQFAAVLIFF